jgi:hypothetical protein
MTVHQCSLGHVRRLGGRGHLARWIFRHLLVVSPNLVLHWKKNYILQQLCLGPTTYMLIDAFNSIT